MNLVVIALAVFVRVSEAGVPLPRKVVLNGDNLEILRLDIMTAEVRISNNVKVMADRVEDALARHGAKLDEARADLQRSNIAAAAAFDRQAARMDVIEDTLNQLINATVFQIDVRPLLNGFESAIKNAGLESRAAAGAAREAAAAANATKEVAKEAVAAAKQTQEEVKKSAAAAPSTKAAPEGHLVHSHLLLLSWVCPVSGSESAAYCWIFCRRHFLPPLLGRCNPPSRLPPLFVKVLPLGHRAGGSGDG